MSDYVRSRATVVWAILVLVTVASWILGADHDLLFGDVTVATCAVLVLAFLKIQLVGTWFMELDHAPVRLALTFTAWVVLTCAALITIYIAA